MSPRGTKSFVFARPASHWMRGLDGQNLLFQHCVIKSVLLKNWRPITKIASKAIASRLKFVLSNLIDHDQTGFLKGRSIAENICLVNNVISYTHLKDIPGLLLFIDFDKAFDAIEWTFVRN